MAGAKTRRGLAGGLGPRRGLCASGCPQPVRLPIPLADAPLAASGHSTRVLPPPPVRMSFGTIGLAAAPVFVGDNVPPAAAEVGPRAAVERGDAGPEGGSAELVKEVTKEARGEGIGDG